MRLGTAAAITLCLAAMRVLSAAAQTAADPGLLAVVNQKEHSLLLVDLATHKPVSTISVGINGHEVAASPDGHTLFVPIYGNAGVGRAGTDGSTIDVIDVPGRKLARSIDLGRPLRPHKDAFGPDGLLYCSAELADAILVIDPKTGKILRELPTGAKESHIFKLTRDGKRAYTDNVGAGSVSVVDVPAAKVLAIIPLSKRVQRMALSNDEHWAFTSDWDQPRVAVIDTHSNALSRWLPTTGMPYVTQPTEDGKYLLVAETMGTKGLLEVFDLATWQPVRSFPLPSAQNGGFLLHGGKVFLSEPLGGRIEILDPVKWVLEPPIVLTLGVDGLAWAH